MERLTDIGRRATTLGFKETESLLEARLKETEEYRKALALQIRLLEHEESSRCVPIRAE